MVISFLFQVLKGKHLGMFGSYTPGEPLFATAEEVLGYREGVGVRNYFQNGNSCLFGRSVIRKSNYRGFLGSCKKYNCHKMQNEFSFFLAFLR